MRIPCAYCGDWRMWPDQFPLRTLAKCDDCCRPVPRAKHFLRSLLTRWDAFVFQESSIPEEVKDEFASFFLAIMAAFFVGSLVMSIVARH